MKKLSLPLLLLLIAISCNINNNQEKHHTLTDNEWREILINTLFLAEGRTPYILKFYDNTRLKDIISDVYINCSNDLGYKINDSILYRIQNRKDEKITNRLDTMLNVSFIYDTINFKENYVTYSEPFFVNNSILCIAMTNKKVKENNSLKWIFFFKKQNGAFKILEFYDVKKNMFYKPSNALK